MDKNTTFVSDLKPNVVSNGINYPSNTLESPHLVVHQQQSTAVSINGKSHSQTQITKSAPGENFQSCQNAQGSTKTTSLGSTDTKDVIHPSIRPPRPKLTKSGPPKISVSASSETTESKNQNGPSAVDQSSITWTSSDRHPRSTSESLQSASHLQSPTITLSENSVGNGTETAEIQKSENFSSPTSVDSTHQNELLSNLSQGKSILTSPSPTNYPATTSNAQRKHKRGSKSISTSEVHHPAPQNTSKKPKPEQQQKANNAGQRSTNQQQGVVKLTGTAKTAVSAKSADLPEKSKSTNSGSI